MRRKVRNWTAFLLALVLVLGMMPTAYAAGYSITVNAPTGNDLPYWVFEKAGVDSADVLNLMANEGHTLPASKVARVSLAVGKNKEDEASCGISINGMYYVQSVTLDHPDFFTGTVEIQVGRMPSGPRKHGAASRRWRVPISLAGCSSRTAHSLGM